MPASTPEAPSDRGTLQRQRVALFAVVLAVATAALYAPVRDYEFIRFDDPRYVTENEHLAEGLSLEMLRWAATSTYKSNWHPLTWVSHAIDIELFGFDAGCHHAVNALFHVLNTLLVLAFLHAATGQVGRSAFVAGVFALHPMHIESVAWIAERKDVLSTFFALLSLCAYLGYARAGGAVRWLATFGALALGLMAKSMLVTLPFVFVLLDYWPLGRARDLRPRSLVPLFREKLGFFALTIGFSLVAAWTQTSSGAARGSAIVSLSDRLANAFVALSIYVGKSFWPTNLALHYPHPNMPLAGGTPWEAWQILFAIVVVGGISLAAFWRRAPRAFFVGWFWFLGMLIPTIGLLQIGAQSHADRYTYLPMVGLAIAVVWTALDASDARRVRSPSVRAIVGVSLLASLWIVSARHLPTWRNSETVFQQALAVSPRDTVMLNNMGNVMHAREEYDLAIDYYRRALAVAPRYRLGRENLLVAIEDRRAARQAKRRSESDAAAAD